MHGLGNDFIIIDAVNQAIGWDKEKIQQLADRHTGIGFDQCLLIEKPANANTDFNIRIFNADGQAVEQCGNGMRCVARFIADKRLSDKKQLRLATHAAIVIAHLNDDTTISVKMGIPHLQPADIPLLATAQAAYYTLTVVDQTVQVQALNIGNPHAVLTIDDVSKADVQSLGAALNKHPDFPQGVNVGFMQVCDPQHIKLRVYERGAGETRACGSGACAAVVAGRLANKLQEQVTVSLPGGDLHIAWAGEGTNVHMSGPATTVFEGCIELN